MVYTNNYRTTSISKESFYFKHNRNEQMMQPANKCIQMPSLNNRILIIHFPFPELDNIYSTFQYYKIWRKMTPLPHLYKCLTVRIDNNQMYW